MGPLSIPTRWDKRREWRHGFSLRGLGAVHGWTGWWRAPCDRFAFSGRRQEEDGGGTAAARQSSGAGVRLRAPAAREEARWAEAAVFTEKAADLVFGNTRSASVEERSQLGSAEELRRWNSRWRLAKKSPRRQDSIGGESISGVQGRFGVGWRKTPRRWLTAASGSERTRAILAAGLRRRSAC